ncbi:MAG: hypothetical protein RLZZ480_875 [Candidatus Parcubacteria bacterium]|jgi:hypothetical protein
MENHTAKHFVLQLGSLLSLYLSLSFLLVMAFGVINITFPDATDTYYNIADAQSMIRIGIAMTIVFFPAYLILTRTVNHMRRKEKNGAYLDLTKWLIYLSLLVGGGVLLGDLVTVINTYLNGEITERFIYKAFSVLVVVGAAFHYYLLDARGYWIKNEQKSVLFGAGVIIVVLVALGQGFVNVESPTTVREKRLDSTQVSDLAQIQYSIENYYYSNQKLPDTLAQLTPAAPNAPEDRPAYKYQLVAGGFELCATFSHNTPEGEYPITSMPVMEKTFIQNPDNWQHGTGETCFKRTVNSPLPK